MLPFTGRNGLCHGLCPVDLAWFGRLSPPKTAAIALVAMLMAFNVACGPSNEDVARAAEESISGIAAIAVANLKCSVEEMFSGGNAATEVMESNSDRMEELTDSLQNSPEASNREKMRAINAMNDLYDSWAEDLTEIGCELPDQQAKESQ